MIPQAVKDKAQELYLSGDKVSVISRELEKEFEFPVKTATIYAWIRKDNWTSLRGELTLQANGDVATQVREEIVVSTNEHSDAYKNLWTKAGQALGLDDPDSQITFTKTADAVKALDIGIQGERKVQQGIVNSQLIMKIYSIISEEIEDENAMRRIAVRFRTLAEEVSNL